MVGILAEAPGAEVNLDRFSPNSAWVLETKGRVDRVRGQARESARAGAELAAGDHVETWANARAHLLWYGRVGFQMRELSEVIIPPAPGKEPRGRFNILKGWLHFFHRGQAGSTEIQMPTAVATVLGTEFSVRVADDGTAVLVVLDGQVSVESANGQAMAGSGDQVHIERGKAPVVRPMVEAESDVLQWFLYYPGLLHVDELELDAAERTALTASLEAYRIGDLRAAVDEHGRAPADIGVKSDAGRIYRAALALAVGLVEPAEQALAAVGSGAAGGVPSLRDLALASAVRRAIAVVRGAPLDGQAVAWTNELAGGVNLASVAAVESLERQACGDLEGGRAAARRAVDLAPTFAYGWARLAEMEFGFGRRREAQAAAERALALAPRHAEAQALLGFVRAAEGDLPGSLAAFETAIGLDGSLGHAWLGRGLCRIRKGDLEGGRTDLLVAAAVEPQRSLLRSYLGKAWMESRDYAQAERELALARKLDPNDPTPWLYSSLRFRALNRFNSAITDLEESLERNDQRRLFRSRLMLDQDRAVRGTSLADLYRAVGLPEVGVHEAARAVAADPANYAAHLFLAHGFDAQRDPTRFNLRPETAWFNELLLANLLAPVDAGVFAQGISHQEYSHFFDPDRHGLTSLTEIRSDGVYRETLTHSGRSGAFGYAVDLDYEHRNGLRPNNELDRFEGYAQFKHQLSAWDTLFLLLKYQNYHAGDQFQYFDWHAGVRTNFTFDEYQHPIAVGGWHREWSPGVHTLFLGGRLVNDQRLRDTAVPELVLLESAGAIVNAGTLPFDVRYRHELDAYTAELSHLVHREAHTLFVGTRYQAGEIEARDHVVAATSGLPLPFSDPAARTHSIEALARIAGYAYYTIEPLERLHLTAGLSYESARFPENFRTVPIQRGDETVDHVGPKAALVYTPIRWATLRASYARSLGGVSLEQSFRLEPTQLAGFIQTFRSLLPESVVGSISAVPFETAGAATDLRLPGQTYLGLEAGWWSAEVGRTVGAFRYVDPTFVPSSTRQRLHFTERSVGLSVGRLLGTDWSGGIAYRFTASELSARFPEIPPGLMAEARSRQRSDLHQVTPAVNYQHACGVFGRVEVDWFWQQNERRNAAGSTAAPDDAFDRINLYTGWRWRRQRGDVTLGVLNAGGSDYHLNPLSSQPEMARERVFLARLRLRF